MANYGKGYYATSITLRPCPVKKSTFSFRHCNILGIPIVRTTTYGKQSFRFEEAGSEITLLINIRREENYKEFSRIIQTWTRSDNKCLMCERVNV